MTSYIEMLIMNDIKGDYHLITFILLLLYKSWKYSEEICYTQQIREKCLLPLAIFY